MRNSGCCWELGAELAPRMLSHAVDVGSQLALGSLNKGGSIMCRREKPNARLEDEMLAYR